MNADLDKLSYQALVPAEQDGTIDVFEQSAALRISIVDRSGAKALSADWDAPGVYILLDRHDAQGNWGAYVGKAPAGIRSRMRNHLTNKDHWYRAILVKRDTTHGFNSAHTAWLEGRLFDLLEAAEKAKLSNQQRPGDDTLAPYDLPMLEAAVEPLARLLRLIGHDASTPHDDESPSAKRSSKHHGVTLAELIQAGLLRGDEELVSTVSTVPATAELLKDGRVKHDGKTYATPSGAAIAARGGTANGWAMWAVTTPTGRVRLATLRARYLASRG